MPPAPPPLGGTLLPGNGGLRGRPAAEGLGDRLCVCGGGGGMTGGKHGCAPVPVSGWGGGGGDGGGAIQSAAGA